MITNIEELKYTREAMSNIEEALYSLRLKVSEKNPELFHAMAQDYLENIEEMRKEIDEFLGLTILMEYKTPLWIRLVGRYIDIWSTPISVWTSVLNNIKNSVSSVAKILKDIEIPDRIINSVSDFEISGIDSGSLKIGFNLNTKTQYEMFTTERELEAIRLVDEALTKILETSNWFANGKDINELNELFPSESIRDFIVSQTINLMPSSKSKFSIIEFSGSILPVNKPITLNSRSRKRIKELIVVKEDEIEKEYVGVIREIDLDKQHIILRQREDGGPDLQCNFNIDTFNQVKDYLDLKVKIIGIIKRGKQSPLYIKFVERFE